MSRQYYLLVNITKISTLSKNNKLAIKLYNKVKDQILVIENVFKGDMQYVYQLWPCQLYYQEKIDIEIVQIDSEEGIVRKIGKSSPLVKYSIQGEKYKFSDQQSLQLRLTFRVGTKTDSNDSIQNLQLKNLNEQMNQHLKLCRSEIQNYQEFINYTNQIIKDMNKDEMENQSRINDQLNGSQTHKKTSISRKQSLSRATEKSKMTFKKEVDNQPQIYTQQMKSEQKYSQQSENNVNLSIKNSKINAPSEKCSQKSIKDSSQNKSQKKQQEHESSHNSIVNKDTSKRPNSKKQCQDQKQKIQQIQKSEKSPKRNVLNKYRYLQRANFRKYILSKPIQQQSESQTFEQAVSKIEKTKIEINDDKTDIQKIKSAEITQPNTANLDLATFIKKRRQQYRKLINTPIDLSLKSEQKSQKSSSLKSVPIVSAHNQKKNSFKKERVFEINQIIRTDKGDLKSVTSERQDESNYLSGLIESCHSLDKAIKRKKYCQKNKNDSSIVGTNHQIQFLEKKSQTLSANSSRIQPETLMFLIIKSIKITTYTNNSNVLSKRCVITHKNNIYQTDIKNSESNQIQWNNYIKIKNIIKKDQLVIELIMNQGSKSNSAGSTVVLIRDMIKNTKPILKTHLYVNSLAIGFIEIRFELCEDQSRQNNISLPEIKLKSDRKSFVQSKIDDSLIPTMIRQPPKIQSRQSMDSQIKIFTDFRACSNKTRSYTQGSELKKCIYPKIK